MSSDASVTSSSDSSLCGECRSPKRQYNLRSPASSRDAGDLCSSCQRRHALLGRSTVKVLLSCPDLQLPAVQGASGCPSLRACPTCGILLQHDEKHCKKVVCPRCAARFCFVCLKSTDACLKTSGPYGQCSSGVAPRQKSVPVWQQP